MPRGITRPAMGGQPSPPLPSGPFFYPVLARSGGEPESAGRLNCVPMNSATRTRLYSIDASTIDHPIPSFKSRILLRDLIVLAVENVELYGPSVW